MMNLILFWPALATKKPILRMQLMPVYKKIQDHNPENPYHHISGAYQQTLVFDGADCSSPTGSSNMRMFWRNKNDAHVFVLVTEILETLLEEGVYSSAMFVPISTPRKSRWFRLFWLPADSNITIEYDLYDREQFCFWKRYVDTLGNDGTSMTQRHTLWCDDIER